MPQQGSALLFYTTLSSADATLKARILADKLNDARSANQVYGFAAADDLYRNFLHDPQYHWGSNEVRANYGNSNMDVLSYGIGVGDTSAYKKRALETLHYFHGANPLGKVYLTNMSAYGATSSVNEIFHAWYWTDSKWSDAKTSQCGPPPGYMPGGPVANVAAAGIPLSFTPPTGQPAQKSYRDWNGNWPENSYIVNEAGIYYQSAYIQLLSKFAR